MFDNQLDAEPVALLTQLLEGSLQTVDMTGVVSLRLLVQADGLLKLGDRPPCHFLQGRSHARYEVCTL